jgi:predicted ATPase
MSSALLQVLTGAPGSGKTALIERIGPGVRCVPEPARRVLAEQRAVGGSATPERDAASFVDRVWRLTIEDHRTATASTRDDVVLFDRGAPDCISYASLLDVDPAPSIRAAEVHRYAREVLLVEPWEEIYTVDEERTMTYEATIPFHAALVDAYERSGYDLVVVPRGSIEERVAFVRDRLALPP